MKNAEAATPLRTIRLALFSILLIGMLGSVIELILLSHYDDWRQWLPVILILLGLSVSGWHAVPVVHQLQSQHRVGRMKPTGTGPMCEARFRSVGLR